MGTYHTTLAHRGVLYKASGMKGSGTKSLCYLSTYDMMFLMNYYALSPSYPMQLIVFWNLNAREALDNANKDWFQLLNRWLITKVFQKLTGYPWIVLILPHHCIPTNTSHQTLGKGNPNHSPLTHIT
eukprot:184346-Pelagomonas_calceolata.AAC.1